MDTMIDQQIEVGTNQLIHQNPIFANHKTEILNYIMKYLIKKNLTNFLSNCFLITSLKKIFKLLQLFMNRP